MAYGGSDVVSNTGVRTIWFHNSANHEWAGHFFETVMYSNIVMPKYSIVFSE